MKSKCIYKNRVCFIQSGIVFEYERDEDGLSTVIDYLKIKKSQFLESKDEVEIYKFIYNHAKNNNIRNFVCHIDSGVLEKVMDIIVKKTKNSSVRSLLNKCIFVATYSNANHTRDKNKQTGSRFYFALTELDTVLKNIPNGKFGKEKKILACISDSSTPYFKQVADNFIDGENRTVEKVNISKLTETILDDFAKNGGYTVVASLDTSKEYQSFTDAILGSRFREQVLIIENNQADVTAPLLNAPFSSIQTIYSGQCINAKPSVYPGLNPFLTYDICAAILTVCWKSWPKFKETGVLSMK